MEKIINTVRMPQASEYIWDTGWGHRLEYTNWLDEQMSWKNTCYLGDWSFLFYLKISGPDAKKLLSSLCVNSMEKFEIGQAKHNICCNDDGKVIFEGILLHTGEDEYVAEGIPPFWIKAVLTLDEYNVVAVDVDSYFLQVQGPNSLPLLEELTGENLRDIKFMHFRNVTIGGKDVILLRQGMAGEIGFELQGPMTEIQAIRETVMEVGKKYGILEIGGRVAMINHLEACYPTLITEYAPALKGQDFEIVDKILPSRFSISKVSGSFEAESPEDYFRSPFELGWGNRVKFDHDFKGRAALEAESKNQKRCIVTLEWNAEDVIEVFASLYRSGDHYDFMEMPRIFQWESHMDKVMKNDKLIGISSSYGYSYFFRKELSLCIIDMAYSTPGTEVVVIWGEPGHPQKEIRATVAPAPYKKDDRRMDLRKFKL